MANTIYWGQAAVENTNGFGKAPTNNTIDFGEVCADSWSPETNLVGGSAVFSNTKSIELDGIDDYVDCGSFSAYDNGDLSASVWIKKSTMGTYEYAFSNSGSSAKAGFDIVFENAFRRVSVGRRTRTSDTYSGFLDIGFTLNNWHHISFTYNDSTRTLKVYRDGILQSTTIGSASTNSASLNLTIGSYQGSSNYFIGNLDEVSIFNSELSQSDVTNIYNLGVPTSLSSYSSLISWWRCGDGDVSPILSDNGSGGNDGTMTNFTTFSTDVPT